MSYDFIVPSCIVSGPGASGRLSSELARLGARRVLLVTDAFMVSSGLAGRLAAAVTASGIAVTLFDQVEPDPTDTCVEAAVGLLQQEGCDAVVALGGGSPLDAGKAVAVLATNGGALSALEGANKVARPGIPLVAIPTTAGTGSEVTRVVVITDTRRDVKMLIADRHLLPTIALVDPDLTLTMPPALTAHVGIDTLTHGIEAYVSRKATPLSDPLALRCIKLVSDHLETAWREPDNRAAREGMMLAATLGGMAFSNSSVALVHGMSRPIGAIFHVPHGLSNAVLLPEVTRFSIRGALRRYADVSRLMGFADEQGGDERAAEQLVEGLQALNTRLEIPRLGTCRGLDRARFDAHKIKMAEDALSSGSPSNNPMIPTPQDIVDLYERAY